MKLYKVQYRDNHDTDGSAKTFIITINSKHKDDKALLEHEITHVKQWWMFLLLSTPLLFILNDFFPHELILILSPVIVIYGHHILYDYVPLYRQWCEVKAFKKQLEFGGDIQCAAKALSENYNLNISYDKALRLLK